MQLNLKIKKGKGQMVSFHNKWIISLLFLLLTSCASIGPRQISLDRNRYNDVIQDTNLQQLLKNIVHLRYLEPVAFTKVTNVTSSYSLNPSASVNGNFTYVSSFPEARSRTYSVSPTSSLSYQDSPTISYVPVENAEFINSLMSPISLQELAILYTGGVGGTEFLRKLTYQSMNELDNASAASNTYAIKAPRFEKFYHLLALFRKLEHENGYDVLPIQIKGSYTTVIRFWKPYDKSPEAMEIKKMLHVSPNAKYIFYTQDFDQAQTKDTILIRTRSVVGIMSFLAHGVQVPIKEELKGYFPVARYPDGRPFNWSILLNSLFHVYYSDLKPDNAFVSVKLHGHWFYILRNDLQSKASFLLVNRLITLAAGQSNLGSQGPALTIPVGGSR